MLDNKRQASVTETAAAERIERGYLGRVLRLALLAPDPVEAVLNGTQGVELSLPRLMEGLPVAWGEHRSCATDPHVSLPRSKDRGWPVWPIPACRLSDWWSRRQPSTRFSPKAPALSHATSSC